MNASVAITIEMRALQVSGETVQTVDARDLHAVLEVRRDFTTWIRRRVEQYGFQQDRDYAFSPEWGSTSQGGRSRHAYHLSLDMAKELAMVERTERGKQARQYFIDCERQAKATAKGSSLSIAQALGDPAQLRQLLLGSVERQMELESTIAAQACKVAALDRLSEAEGQVSITRAAKSLQMQPRKLFQWLAEHTWIYRPRPSGMGWLAYQQRIHQGVLVHKLTTLPRADGSERIVEQVLVTPRGLARLAELFQYERTLPQPLEGASHG